MPFAERPKPDRGMTWVKPELVCQVKFANWTPDSRLRAPVFLGLAQRQAGAARVVRETWPNCRTGRQGGHLARSTATP